MTSFRRTPASPMPSEVSDDPWVWAWGDRRGADDVERSGKWLVFSSPEDHDAVWGRIRDATRRGELGTDAKAATARQYRRQLSTSKVICVYTTDFADRDDVRRVLRGLRALDVGGRLSYKTDVDTLSGTYGAGAAVYVSQPGSKDFEVRRAA